MKKLPMILGLALATASLYGQAAGNVNYRENGNYNYNNSNRTTGFPESNIATPPPSNPLQISVKGLANLKADSYVAIFALNQTGKTTEEAVSLLDERIKKISGALAAMPKVTTFVDMVSFVPMYEFEVEKKTFSRSYNEVPKGFELKKNLHISFENIDQLHKILSICAEAETYDIVRVDYVSNDMEATKKQLADKAKAKMKEKMAIAEDMLGIKIDSFQRYFSDSYRVFYPVEMYRSYTVYNGSNLDSKSGKSAVNRAEKTSTLYYQPILDKEFDFVISPVVVEPTIQVLYEMRLNIDLLSKKNTPAQKQYFWLTPSGETKFIDIK